jgi:hypothetical protein
MYVSQLFIRVVSAHSILVGVIFVIGFLFACVYLCVEYICWVCLIIICLHCFHMNFLMHIKQIKWHVNLLFFECISS